MKDLSEIAKEFVRGQKKLSYISIVHLHDKCVPNVLWLPAGFVLSVLLIRLAVMRRRLIDVVIWALVAA